MHCPYYFHFYNTITVDFREMIPRTGVRNRTWRKNSTLNLVNWRKTNEGCGAQRRQFALTHIVLEDRQRNGKRVSETGDRRRRASCRSRRVLRCPGAPCRVARLGVRPCGLTGPRRTVLAIESRRRGSAYRANEGEALSIWSIKL